VTGLQESAIVIMLYLCFLLQPFGHGLVTVVVPQLRRGENSLCLWNTVDMTSTVPPPVLQFEGHTDVVLDFHWRSQTIDGK
jgi:hypothetical protein